MSLFTSERASFLLYRALGVATGKYHKKQALLGICNRGSPPPRALFAAMNGFVTFTAHRVGSYICHRVMHVLVQMQI